MFLPKRYVNVLIDLVEARLAEVLVNGCEDRRELWALKQCRRELRAARPDRPFVPALRPVQDRRSRYETSVLAQS